MYPTTQKNALAMICLESLEVELKRYESQLKELNSYSEKLTVEYNEKVLLQEVLEKARRFFMTDAPRLAVSELSTSRYTDGRDDGLLANDNARDLDMRFSSITGVVSTEEKSRFERMNFRATRGNCFVRFAPIKSSPSPTLILESLLRSLYSLFSTSLLPLRTS